MLQTQVSRFGGLRFNMIPMDKRNSPTTPSCRISFSLPLPVNGTSTCGSAAESTRNGWWTKYEESNVSMCNNCYYLNSFIYYRLSTYWGLKYKMVDILQTAFSDFFLERRFLNLRWRYTNQKSTLVQGMAWHRIGNKPLPESIKISDFIWHQQATMS